MEFPFHLSNCIVLERPIQSFVRNTPRNVFFERPVLFFKFFNSLTSLENILFLSQEDLIEQVMARLKMHVYCRFLRLDLSSWHLLFILLVMTKRSFTTSAVLHKCLCYTWIGNTKETISFIVRLSTNNKSSVTFWLWR